MNTILCFFQKCGAALLFGVIYLFQELLLVVLEVGKWLVTRGNQLSDELEKVLVQLKGVLTKECPPFHWPDKLPFWILLPLFIFGWLISRSVYHPTSGPLDLSWLGWIFVFLVVMLALVAIAYALRHLVLWIAGILAVLGLLSLLAVTPSCSVPAGSSDEDAEYCWFWQRCYWKDMSIHWPNFHFPTYCWFWEECYPHDNQESSGSSAPASNKVDHQGAIYCWFWESCFWHKDHSMVLKPTVVKPVKTEEAKVSQPETTEYIIKKGDTLWKLTNGDMEGVNVLAHLNAGVLDPYWIQNCHVPTKKNKWCDAPKHTLQIGMRIFIPVHK